MIDDRSEAASFPLSTEPFPASRKIYVTGSHPGVRVPMREVRVAPTHTHAGLMVENPAVTVYDTSGPYTDPEVEIDLRRGLAPLRREWILGRADVEELPAVSSEYGRRRASDPKLDGIRFADPRKPLVARPGGNVTQMH